MKWGSFMREKVKKILNYKIYEIRIISVLITFILFLSVALAVIFPKVSIPLVIILGCIILFIATSCVIDNAIDEFNDKY